MKKPFLHLATALALLSSAGCRQPAADLAFLEGNPELLHAAVQNVTDAMMESITSPPVASRTYAYSSIAAYETLRQGATGHVSLVGRLNGLAPVPEPSGEGDILRMVAGVNAYLTVAEALVFAPEHVAAHREALVDSLRSAGVPRALLNRSLEHGASVGRHILAWAGSDGLKAARASARLEVRAEPGRWMPTPPAYFQAVEPNWGTLRPFVLDSAGQFVPEPPTPFDVDKGTEFHRQMMEVYEVSQSLTPEQRDIAGFWDCNPFVMETVGHIMSSTRKISPGGHWMGITRIAARQTGADPVRTAEAYARVSVALADGFISSWKEKYRSIRIRPETVIQQHVDPSWRPLLQTPPFPEYTSGHSVISGAAAEVLTDLFGENFAFRDDTEVPFGIPARDFSSFREAADEAALSRLYGGIHYRDAIENGLVQGRQIGRLVVERVATGAPRLAASQP